MTNANETLETLVLGGTGKIGRRVAERLLARGVRTRVGSRSGRPPFDCQVSTQHGTPASYPSRSLTSAPRRAEDPAALPSEGPSARKA